MKIFHDFTETQNVSSQQMNLISITIDGIKRFSERTQINVVGKLVAIVGPNESGKSSLLRTLLHFNHNKAFLTNGPAQETTRGKDFESDHEAIRAVYLIDQDDKEAISHIEDTEKVTRIEISKRLEGDTFYVSLIPRPERSTVPRRQARDKLQSLLKSIGFSPITSQDSVRKLEAMSEDELSTDEARSLFGDVNIHRCLDILSSDGSSRIIVAEAVSAGFSLT
ncbi:MAG: AAA family ATPase, partial [Planctomycetaceae bacterium]|nr:AAA family ATPase [Planctomycetaceae bacterium]